RLSPYLGKFIVPRFSPSWFRKQLQTRRSKLGSRAKTLLSMNGFTPRLALLKKLAPEKLVRGFAYLNAANCMSKSFAFRPAASIARSYRNISQDAPESF